MSHEAALVVTARKHMVATITAVVHCLANTDAFRLIVSPPGLIRLIFHPRLTIDSLSWNQYVGRSGFLLLLLLREYNHDNDDNEKNKGEKKYKP